MPFTFLQDEPTSGLDSASAGEVLRCVASLAASRRIAVVATLHAPPESFFTRRVDALVLLVGGRVAFFGPPAAAAPHARGSWPPAAVCAGDAAAEEAGGEGGDAAWLLHAASAAAALEPGAAAALAASYEASPLGAERAAALACHAAAPVGGPRGGLGGVWRDRGEERRQPPPWRACTVLLRYRTPRQWANPAYMVPRLGKDLVVTSLIWSLCACAATLRHACGQLDTRACTLVRL